MENNSRSDWHPSLADPTGMRTCKPRGAGLTMVIDKGMGIHAFEDMVRAGSDYIDYIKLGFGTSALYPKELLRRKIELARESGIHIMPGGTFLEVAVSNQLVEAFMHSLLEFGFSAIEVSDGTIEMNRSLRSSLIVRGVDAGLNVLTEYGKKQSGFQIEKERLAETVAIDTGLGAALVTIEARESGKGIGIFDESGACNFDDLYEIISCIPDTSILMWEAPLKSQQAELLQAFGPNLNIGNVAPEDALALEALRRGLRSDTFHLGQGARV